MIDYYKDTENLVNCKIDIKFKLSPESRTEKTNILFENSFYYGFDSILIFDKLTIDGFLN